MKQFFVIAFSFVSSFIYSQSGDFDATANLQSAETNMFRSFDNRYKGVKGYPTVSEKFVKGDVVLKSGVVGKDQELNYDAMTSELLLKSKAYNGCMVLKAEKVSSFRLYMPEGEIEFVNVDGVGFCRKRYEGKAKFYERIVKHVEKANYGGAYNTNARQYDEFVEESIFFLQKENGPVKEVKLKKKSIEAEFPERSEAIKSYVKEHRPKFGEPSDLVLLLEYLDRTSTP